MCECVSSEALEAAEESVRLFDELAAEAPVLYEASRQDAAATLAKIEQAMQEQPDG